MHDAEPGFTCNRERERDTFTMTLAIPKERIPKDGSFIPALQEINMLVTCVQGTGSSAQSPGISVPRYLPSKVDTLPHL